ncbi:cytosolic sulfotransferase 15 [Phtheirospermum japonicum]|uniref:Cytosolic sulfotransferase 15 n=1 Tax=Phtheirospermum japonicum TaxID=374723 RepID=A0A830C2T5_9LAMI|nr:cytosolic sulfotransferase 15 [Phtheirospermum japonicum]
MACFIRVSTSPILRANLVCSDCCQDSAWLPTWLHHCNFDQLNVEGIKQITSHSSSGVEELQFLQKGVRRWRIVEARRWDVTLVNYSYLELTAHHFSYAQSANNGPDFMPFSSVACIILRGWFQFHLHLSSSGDDSENTDLTTDGPQTNSNYPSITQPLEDSGISVQRDVNKRAANRSPSLGLERPISKFELSKHDENGNLSEAADDIVELCIAASEAMVKRARLEVWSNTFSCPTNLTSEIDSLSDLDDMTMESAYEDAGIHIHESYGNELSVSQVKDTFNDSCARITEGVIDDDDVQVGNDLTGECFNGGTRKTVIGNPVRGLGTDVDVGYEDYCLRVVDTHGELHISVPAETPENEVKYTTVKHTVPEPFACETSFLSESAPDQNSFVQNHDKEAITASQLSTRTENLYNRAMDDETLISQDVRSSNASLVDPLCSVVPCSISENICSSPAVNYEDNINPGHFNITTECEKENNAQGEKIGTPIANIKELRNGVSRRFTSLADYSKQFPISTKFPEIDCGQKDSFLLESNIESTFWENRDETLKVGDEVSNKENTNTLSHLMDERRKSHFWASNSSTDNEENPIGTALPESKTPSVQKLGASKRVRFCEEETKISDKKKLRKAQIESKTCSSTRASKKSTRLSAYLESRARQMDREKKRLIFQNVEFLLTGFSQKKEKEIEGLIRKYGGIVLYQLPLINLTEKRSSRFKSRAVPIVLCLKKIQSFKFLYGCAVNGYVLKVNWLNDSIAAGFVLPPKKYMILPRNISRSQDQVYTAVNYNTHSLVFNNSGVMLHGKTKYFTNIATIIKHGGGQVFKTLQRLVQALEAGKISMGIVVVHDESCASRHLKHCALEKNISTTSVQWIIKSLYAGQLIPLEEEKSNSRSRPTIKLQRHQDSMDLSQEI